MTSGRTYTFTVKGTPRPKGSYKPVPAGRGQMICREMYYPIRMIRFKPQSKRYKPWVKNVQQVARAVAPDKPLTGPVEVGAVFYFERPKKTKYPDYPQGSHVGDVDKLQRAIGDALEGIFFENDSQIVRWAPPPERLYADDGKGARAEITIRDLSRQEVLFT